MVIPTRVFTDEPEPLKLPRGVAESGLTEEPDAGTTSRTSRIEPAGVCLVGCRWL